MMDSPMVVDSQSQSPSRKREGSPVRPGSPVKRTKSVEDVQNSQVRPLKFYFKNLIQFLNVYDTTIYDLALVLTHDFVSGLL